MNISKYEKQAMRTSPEGHDRILNGCMGLIGESGEIVDLVKKWKFQSGKNAKTPVEQLVEECGDVMWYCVELCRGLGTSLNTLYHVYIAKPHADIEKGDLVQCACELSMLCHLPYESISTAVIQPRAADDTPLFGSYARLNAQSTVYLPRIVLQVEYILDAFCGKRIEDALSANILKLKARYPDGFDPERSIYRN